MKGINAYKKTAISTSDPMDILVALYDGFLRNVRRAQELMGLGHRAEAGECLSKAIAIVNELQISLQEGVDQQFTDRLSALYFFVVQELLQTSLKADPDRLDDVLGIMSELRDAWAQAASEVRSGQFQSPAR